MFKQSHEIRTGNYSILRLLFTSAIVQLSPELVTKLHLCSYNLRWWFKVLFWLVWLGSYCGFKTYLVEVIQSTQLLVFNFTNFTLSLKKYFLGAASMSRANSCHEYFFLATEEDLNQIKVAFASKLNQFFLLIFILLKPSTGNSRTIKAGDHQRRKVKWRTVQHFPHFSYTSLPKFP